MVQTWSRLRRYAFPLFALERMHRDGVRLLLVALFWLGRVWFSDLISLLRGSTWEIPVRRDLLSQVEGTIFHPAQELWKLWVWPLRGTSSNPELPQRGNCMPWSGNSSPPVGSVLEFLEARFSAGLTHSTLKVYVAAAYHAPLGGQSLGRHPLITHFLRGALRLRSPVQSRVPRGTWPWSWRLSVNHRLNHLRRFQIEFWHLRLSSC